MWITLIKPYIQDNEQRFTLRVCLILKLNILFNVDIDWITYPQHM